MNQFDVQRKNTLIETLLMAKSDADRFLHYIVEDSSNKAEVEKVRTARRHTIWALNDLTGEEHR